MKMVLLGKRPPFGSNTKRFGKNTGHPNLDLSGLYVDRPKGCDPCLYNPQGQKKVLFISNKGIANEPWRYKSELEDWSKNLGYRNQKILEQKKWFKSILGPAWHYLPEPTKYESACNNLTFGRTPRFKQSKGGSPDPGTYYRSEPYRAPYGPHSFLQTFDMQEHCRFKDRIPNWCLAPDRYKIVDKDSISEKPLKIVSTRGPYNLFTGPRDGTTIKNHFSSSLKCSAATWPLALGGSLETYKKSLFGTMNKTNRDQPCRSRNMLVDISMCLRKANEPGPADINIDKAKVIGKNMHGFNSTYDKPPGYRRVVVWPGVGRYNVKTISCGIDGKGHRHVFLSKQGRTIGALLPERMNTF